VSDIIVSREGAQKQGGNIKMNFETELIAKKYEKEINNIVCGYEGADIIQIANEIQEMVEDNTTETDWFYRELVNAALERVDWIAIAKKVRG
jgi:hypothetical protein